MLLKKLRKNKQKINQNRISLNKIIRSRERKSETNNNNFQLYETINSIDSEYHFEPSLLSKYSPKNLIGFSGLKFYN